MIQSISTPLNKTVIAGLKAGDSVRLSGVIYTARDAAHKRMIEQIQNGKTLPFDIKGQVIYYVGPTPTRPGYASGSAGPTTSMRMNDYAPVLIKHGLRAMIGKGEMGDQVSIALQQHHAVYFAAVGGAGALMAQCIRKSQVIAWTDLGPEAVRKLIVSDLPLIVGQDSYGNNLFQNGVRQYKQIGSKSDE